jgi:hypothetical protein
VRMPALDKTSDCNICPDRRRSLKMEGKQTSGEL